MAKKKVSPTASPAPSKDISGLSSGTLLIVIVFFALVLLSALLKLQGL